MARITTSLALSSALLAIGCSSSSTSTPPGALTVTDTLNNQFSASCSSSLCVLTPHDPTIIKPLSCSVGYGTDTFVILWSRVLTIHAMNVVSGSAVEFSSAEPSKPVACSTDAECTLWNATLSGVKYEYTCLNGICQDATKNVSVNDAIALCQSDIPWPTACPYITSQKFASRMAAVGAACGPGLACAAVPADCKQPSAGLDGGAPEMDGGVTGVENPPAAIDAAVAAAGG